MWLAAHRAADACSRPEGASAAPRAAEGRWPAVGHRRQPPRSPVHGRGAQPEVDRGLHPRLRGGRLYIWTAEGGTGQGSDDAQHRWKAGGGWLYVAVVIDLFSRQVVGWSMSDTMTAQLVTDALMMAIWRRGKPDALLHHSDQGGAAQGSGDAQHRWNGCGGSQYTSEKFQRLMGDNGVTCSMSRSGNVWDNAAVNRRRTGTPDRRRPGTPWGRWRTSIVRDCRAACDVGRA